MVISTYHKKSAGFTLIELMIVVAIIGILAAIAYPSYQQYVIKTKRADMMSEMQNIAQQIERQKLSAGTYTKVSTAGMTGDYNSVIGFEKENPIHGFLKGYRMVQRS